MKSGKLRRNVLKRAVEDRLAGYKIETKYSRYSTRLSSNLPSFIKVGIEDILGYQAASQIEEDIQIRLSLATSTSEDELRIYIDEISKVLLAHGKDQIASLDIEVMEELSSDWIEVSTKKRSRQDFHAKVGDLILLTDNLGFSGAGSLYALRRSYFEQRYNSTFNQRAASLWQFKPLENIYAKAQILVNDVYHIGSQGLYGCLDTLRDEGLRFVINLDKVVLSAEVVEILEAYKANPFLISSVGAALIFVKPNQVDEYKEARVIGEVTSTGNKLIRADKVFELEGDFQDEFHRLMKENLEEIEDEKRNIRHDKREC